MVDKVEVDLIVKAITEGFSQMSKDISGIGKASEDAEKATKKSSGGIKASLTDLKSGIDMAIGAARVFGQAVAQAFDAAQQGAKIDVLRQSIQSLGMDMEAIQEKSRGTVSEFEAMNATATILAGTQGDLKAAFIDNAANLMEIAKAANTVNPALGDTGYLYQSLATGIKRSSSMILDNLGLVVKIGEANEAYAKQLGKSVDALTSEEKQMALLNATLKAGNVLIQQAQGVNTETADTYARMRATIDDTKNAFKEALGEGLEPFVSKLEEGMRASLDLSQAKEVLRRAFELGVISADKYNTALSYLIRGENYNAQAVIESAAQYENYIEMLDQTANETGDMVTVNEELTDQLKRSGVVVEDAAADIDDLGEKTAQAGKSAESAKRDFAELYGELNQDWGAKFTQFLSDLQFYSTGGKGFAALNDQLYRAATQLLTMGDYAVDYAEPKLTEVADKAKMAWYEYQVEIGNMTAYDAATAAAGEFGIAWDDAYASVTDTGSAVEEVAGLESELKDIITRTEGIAEAAALMGIPFEEAEAWIAGIWSYMQLIDGQTVTAYINLIGNQTGGNIGAGGAKPGGGTTPDSGYGGGGGSPTPQALGGEVLAGRSYLVGERGAELFTPQTNGAITSNADLSGFGGGVTNNFYAPVTVTADAPEADIMAMRTS